jgi:hypothetical protein
MPGFAADALEAGFDGPSLRKLAGLVQPTFRDVGDLFQKALLDIGTIKIQTQEQAVFALSRLTAADIVEGRVEPIEGANVLAMYAQMLCYPEFLANFLQLSEMPLWGEYAPPREKLVQDIIEQSRALLANVPE